MSASLRRRIELILVCVSVVPRLLTIQVVAAGASETNDFYFQRFVETSARDTSLVNTNNAGPNLTNSALSYAAFSERGELAGVKLGMTMSEVVAVWGKPRWLFSHCAIGPRFGYGFGSYYGELTLFFVGNRVAVIEVYGPRTQYLAFDNGLRGSMSRAECEKVLGPPIKRTADDRESFVLGGNLLSHRRYSHRPRLQFHREGKTACCSDRCLFGGGD